MQDDKNPRDQNPTSCDYIPSSSVTIDKSTLVVSSKWVRLLFMILFAICYGILRWIAYFLAVIQFLVVLVTNKPHEGLLRFSQGLSYYSYQIVRFLTYNTEERPFPFSPWPQDRI